MADEDIDSLLEAGIRAAQMTKDDSADAAGTDHDDNSKALAPQEPPIALASVAQQVALALTTPQQSPTRPRSAAPLALAVQIRRSRRSRKSRSRSRSGARKSRTSRSKSVEKEPRARSTSAERAERAKQRELMELTRDHRTVFVGQLTQKVRERDLEKFFGALGKLERVLLIRDKFTSRSKGFAYVEMSHLEDVPKALVLNGHVPPFQSFPLLVKASEAEKNFAAKKDSVIISAAAAAAATSATGPSLPGGSNSNFGGTHSHNAGRSAASLSAASRIYCGNLHANITEDDLRCVFQAFGDVVSVTINRDELGRSRGFGFIQFSAPDEANFALSKGNGLELAGNHLRLGNVNDHTGGGGGGHYHHAHNSSSGGGGSWKLEDDEGAGGLSMTSQSRTALMAKLAGSKDMFPTLAAPSASLHAPVAAPVPTAVASVNPALAQYAERAAALASLQIEGAESFCFVIKNMFDVANEIRTGAPDWDVEIKQDVEDECASYGTVRHSFVEKEKDGGLVYVLFDSVSSAVQAAKVLHGRWFNQRQISVRYLSPQEYVGMFPEVRSAVQSARTSSA